MPSGVAFGSRRPDYILPLMTSWGDEADAEGAWRAGSVRVVALGAAAALQRRKGDAFWEAKRVCCGAQSGGPPAGGRHLRCHLTAPGAQANIGYTLPTEGGEGGGGDAPGAHVAPGRRGGGAGGASAVGLPGRDDSTTLRVTNIGTDATVGVRRRRTYVRA